MSELKLLPCPFCGGEAILSPSYSDSPDGDFAACNSEFCTVWVRAKRWNNRADDKRIEELEAQVEKLESDRPVDVYNQGWNDALKALVAMVRKYKALKESK